MFQDLLQDVRFGARLLMKKLGFTSVAVLTITLGIGVTTAIFSLINSILLRPLPYPEEDSIVRLLQSYPEKGLDTWRLSPANFSTYHDRSSLLTASAAYWSTGVNLTGTDKPERLQGAKVTADFFKVLGVEPRIGASFLPEHDVPGKTNVCVLSYGFWQRHFGNDASIIGKTLTIDNAAVQVLGIMPQGFDFPLPETEIWIPLGLNTQATHPYFLTGIARLKPGASLAAVQSETTEILRSAGQQNPHMVGRNDPPPPGAGLKTLVIPLKEAIVGKTRKPLLVLQFSVIFILLIACANVANLLLSRSAIRSREIAVRYALGSSPKRVIQQLLTESVLLSILGAIPGIGLAWVIVRLLSRSALVGIPRIEQVGINGVVLLFVIALSLVTGLLFGLAPAIRTYRMGLAGCSSEIQRGSSGRSNRWMNRTLVGGQIALCLMLLIGAGLVLKSLRHLLAVDPGFQANNVLTMLLPVTNQKYPTPPQQVQFYQSLLQQVQALPGVTGAAVTSTLPFGGEDDSDGYIVEGQEPPPGSDPTQAALRTVSPGYFQTMGMSLDRGRDFLNTDTDKSPLVVIVDETLARRYWPNGDALGKRVRTTGDPPWLTIVGVVNGVKDQSLAEDMLPHLYFPHGQQPDLRMYLVFHSAGDPASVNSSVVRKIHELDADVPVYAVRSMPDVVNRTLTSQKLTDLLLSIFAGLALVLAAIGIYGVMSIFVTSRSREFGIRLAVGAEPGSLLLSVMRQGLLLTLGGIAVGLIGAFIFGRSIASLLYNVSAADPVTFLGISLLLVSVALLSCYWPARRAARTNPLVVLRYE
ncbi:MAG TPA: ABC transporter permease [Candidatus Angelobacter sp.]|jgi:putative ABC transport system permease protein